MSDPQSWPGIAVVGATAQDIQRGKPTEIDSLNGYIVRRGAELGIEVPLNHALFTLVKMRDEKSG